MAIVAWCTWVEVYCSELFQGSVLKASGHNISFFKYRLGFEKLIPVGVLRTKAKPTIVQNDDDIL